MRTNSSNPVISRGKAVYTNRDVTITYYVRVADYSRKVLGYIQHGSKFASRSINSSESTQVIATNIQETQTATLYPLDKSTQPAKTNARKPKHRKLNYPLVGLISSKNPIAALEVTVQSLFAGGCESVVVVDDGSDEPESLAVFDRVEAAGATVIHLERNVGKSKALKVGFKSISSKSIIVQTDDDTLAGNLDGPAKIIRERKADIVDIRIEAIRTSSVIGLVQELDYWLINAVTKRVQNWLRARLWMSGASVMYSYKAGKELLLKPAHSMTEDTEGLFRARSKGFRVRYYSKHDAQFLTMVPEDYPSLHKQWKRWSTGNGQVIGIYGLGAGDARIAVINAFAWFSLLILPILAILHFGIINASLWQYGWGVLMGIVGAIRLKRPRLLLVGMFIPYISLLWAIYALYGLFLAWQIARSGQQASLTWVSPKRTTVAVELTTS